MALVTVIEDICSLAHSLEQAVLISNRKLEQSQDQSHLGSHHTKPDVSPGDSGVLSLHGAETVSYVKLGQRFIICLQS